MSRTKQKMNQQIDEMLAALKTFDLLIFEDEIAEDEQERFKKNGHHFFVYATGDFIKNDDKKTLTQDIAIYYYSENLPDLDERIIDIVEALPENKLFTLVRIGKQRLQRKDTDSFVDRIIFMYNRTIVMQRCIT
ncbi:hypothetical protein [Metasolibacillus meyeri]|uniref:hypothetical protein n=1 Tax=Metasolibacillus meyeri TaxID=1071052 RepID=UPI00128FEEA4|nr:hypothetical protein [Metasolibacillus meyeri]